MSCELRAMYLYELINFSKPQTSNSWRPVTQRLFISFRIFFRIGYQQVLLFINKSLSSIISRCKCLRQINRIFRACFFTITTENAAQHIDLVFGCIFFFFVQMLLPWLPFCSFHGNGFRRTSNGTQTTGSATFTTFFIAVQYLQRPEYFRKCSLLFGILYGYFSFK